MASSGGSRHGASSRPRSPKVPVAALVIRVFTEPEGGTRGGLYWFKGRSNSTEGVTDLIFEASWPGTITDQAHGLWCLHDLMRQYYASTRPARPQDSASSGKADVTET